MKRGPARRRPGQRRPGRWWPGRPTDTDTPDPDGSSPSPSPSARAAPRARSSASATPTSESAPSSAPPSDSPAPSPSPSPSTVPGLGATDQAGPGYLPPADASPTAAPPAGSPAPNPETTTAVQTALRTEYAAVWAYTLVTAFLRTDLEPTAQLDLEAHRARRDATIGLLTEYQVPPTPAEPSYRTPAPVTDSASAIRLVLSAETDSAAAWRSVLERCDDQGLRHVALDRLTDSAVRAAHWSVQLGSTPVVPAFPGQSSAT